jgi:asparagine synthase (glutamine-hydrolysing)
MCGILGFFDVEVKSFVPETAMRAGLAHLRARGPDAEALHLAPGLALGHTRLVVIDPEGGDQPFLDPATGALLVFNGEIFNFRELRRDLAGRGHVFRGRSDTEVLLRAYLEWDFQCLKRLHGMFAFAIYDPQRERLLLARDRLGVKPLFYARHGTALMFASSCSALRCLPGVGAAMDPGAVSHYLTSIRTTLGRRTLLRDVQTLLPGEYLTMSRQGREPVVRPYWSIPAIPAADKDEPEFEKAAAHVRDLMEEAVKAQLISDVPLGGFLSGGLDSCVIASVACRETGGNFHAYNVGYDRPGYNEWPYVQAAAGRYGMRCRTIRLDESAFPGTWARLIRSKGMPVSTPNEIGIYHLAQALKQDYTVALSGEGADEILGGYTIPQFGAFDFDRARRAPRPPGEPPDALDGALQRLYGRDHFSSILEHYLLLNSWVPFSDKIQLLTGEAWCDVAQDAALLDFYGGWFERLKDCSTFDAYMHVHARVNMEGLLSRVDSSTMAASVEARVPFTDHRLVEYLFGLPDRYKIDWRDGASRAVAADRNIAEIDQAGLLASKRLLRRAFCNDVPAEILERPKASFPVPFTESIAAWMDDLPDGLLRDSPLAGTLFRPDSLERLLRSAGEPRSAMTLWPVVNLCLWQRECGAQWAP